MGRLHMDRLSIGCLYNSIFQDALGRPQMLFRLQLTIMKKKKKKKNLKKKFKKKPVNWN